MENNFRLALTILVSLMIMCIIENSMSRKIKKNIANNSCINHQQ